jgi:hypothetical protein
MIHRLMMYYALSGDFLKRRGKHMPNNKMMAVAMTILDTMMKAFPQEHLEFMFCGLLDSGDVVEMVMLNLIKRTYDKVEEKHSLRYFYEKYGITEMNQIMRYSVGKV